MRILTVVLSLTLFIAAKPLPEDLELELALSAATRHLRGGASVLLLGKRGYEEARHGSNGFTCLVGRSHPKSIAPMCFDAEAHVIKRFPHKKTKPVGNSLLPSSIRDFLAGLSVVFQRNQSAGLDTTYHFTFTGDENAKATIVIRDQTLQVLDGHHGRAVFRMTADGQTWIGFLKKERSLAWALLRRKIRFRGSPKLLLAFSRCFLG